MKGSQSGGGRGWVLSCRLHHFISFHGLLSFHFLPLCSRVIKCKVGKQTALYVDVYYQDSDSITQSELMRMMNDNSKDEEIQVGSYSSYIPTESVHGPGHA